VLVPSLIKQDLPHLAGLAMSLYVALLTLGATLAAGVTAPLVHSVGWTWEPALAAGAMPAVLAGLAWLPQLRQHHRPDEPDHSLAGESLARRVWRSSIAWQLATLMAIQSLLFYSVLTWLPALLQEQGLAPPRPAYSCRPTTCSASSAR